MFISSLQNMMWRGEGSGLHNKNCNRAMEIFHHKIIFISAKQEMSSDNQFQRSNPARLQLLVLPMEKKLQCFIRFYTNRPTKKNSLRLNCLVSMSILLLRPNASAVCVSQFHCSSSQCIPFSPLKTKGSGYVIGFASCLACFLKQRVQTSLNCGKETQTA